MMAAGGNMHPTSCSRSSSAPRGIAGGAIVCVLVRSRSLGRNALVLVAAGTQVPIGLVDGEVHCFAVVADLGIGVALGRGGTGFCTAVVNISNRRPAVPRPRHIVLTYSGEPQRRSDPRAARVLGHSHGTDQPASHGGRGISDRSRAPCTMARISITAACER